MLEKNNHGSLEKRVDGSSFERIMPPLVDADGLQKKSFEAV